MVALNTNSVDSIFLSHNHVFHEDYLKYSQLFLYWHSYSLRRHSYSSPPSNMNSHTIKYQPYLTYSILSSPIFFSVKT